jgi:hypothetical protein
VLGALSWGCLVDIYVSVVVVYNENLAGTCVLIEKHVVLLSHVLWCLSCVKWVYLLRQYSPVVVETLGVVADISVGLGQGVL